MIILKNPLPSNCSIVKFHPKHLQEIEIQADQKEFLRYFATKDYHDMLMKSEAYTALYNGKVVLCSGVLPLNENVGRAWALLSKDAGIKLLLSTREIFNFLLKSQYARIETPVRRDFVNGHRWCKLLGFVNETPNNGMKHYGVNGETYDLYALYKKE